MAPAIALDSDAPGADCARSRLVSIWNMQEGAYSEHLQR